MPDVPRFCGYVLGLSISSQRHSANVTNAGMGITLVYKTSQPVSIWGSLNLGTPFYSIALSLNVLLTLMIATRLILHSRDIRNALGPLVRADRLYVTLVTILVESSALFAANSLLYIGPLYAGSSLSGVFITPLTVTQVRSAITLSLGTTGTFPPNHGDKQVIAPFLITLRVANRTALTSEDITTGNIIGSIHFDGRGKSVNDKGTFADGNSEIYIEMDGDTPAE